MSAIGPLPEKAARAYQAAPHFRGIIHEGAVRTAKTVGSLVDWVRHVTTGPATGLYVMTGRTERTVRNNLYSVLLQLLGPTGVVWKQSGGTIDILGHAVQVVGANDAQAAAKIQGMTAAGFYFDELPTLPQSYYRMALSRLSVPGARWIATGNPDGPGHWLLAELERARVTLDQDGTVTRRTGSDGLDLLRARYILADNPYLAPEYIEQLHREYTGLWHDRYVKGLWVAAEGAIYPMLDPQRHALPAPDTGDALHHLVAIDYGTANPTHAVLIAVTRDRLHVASEWRHDGRGAAGPLTDSETAQRLADWVTSLGLDYRTIETRLDPSAASLRAQLRRDDWAGARAADNAVVDGIRETASLLGRRRLVIDRGECPHLWREMTGYRWDEKAQARGEDKPAKVDDHGADALRYGVRAARRWWRGWLEPLPEPEYDGPIMTPARRKLQALTGRAG